MFYFSDRTYAFLSKFFMVIMVANIVLVLIITVIAAKPEHYWQVLLGYTGISFLTDGYPEALPKTDALALFNQPGGSLMWVSFWVISAGFGMGLYAGQVTGVLRPPERITVQELHWDTTNPEERRERSRGAQLRSGRWNRLELITLRTAGFSIMSPSARPGEDPAPPGPSVPTYSV